jgi:hypothetical protein
VKQGQKATGFYLFDQGGEPAPGKKKEEEADD